MRKIWKEYELTSASILLIDFVGHETVVSLTTQAVVTPAAPANASQLHLIVDVVSRRKEQFLEALDLVLNDTTCAGDFEMRKREIQVCIFI